MREASGHITVNERVPTDRFNTYVEEQVSEWIAAHKASQTGVQTQAASPGEYEVAFFDEESLGEISCLIVIHVDGQLWRAWETGDNPKAALARSLEALRVDDEATDAQQVTH